MQEEKMIAEITKLVIQIVSQTYEEMKEEMVQKLREENIKKIKVLLKKYKILKKFLNIADKQSGGYIEVEESIREETHIRQIFYKFNKALEVFQKVCITSDKEEDMRCYQVIWELYIKEENEVTDYLRGEDKYSLIAEKFHINKRTVYKDIDRASSMISALYFGIFY